MKVLVILGLGLLAVLVLGSCRFELNGFSGAPVPNPKSDIESVNGILEQATRAGMPPKAGSLAAKLNNQCAWRERRLQSLRRPRSLTDVAPHAQRILAVLRAHSKRAAEPPDVRALDAEQQRLVASLARAARAGNYRAAQSHAMSLRELAGRANVTFMRLGLTQCVMRATAMPL
jgi:hypothetical protein